MNEPIRRNVITAASPTTNKSVLEVHNLQTQFFTDAGILRAVDGVSFSVAAGESPAPARASPHPRLSASSTTRPGSSAAKYASRAAMS